MPYSHAGEIGDVWKHWPLLDVLSILCGEAGRAPARYIETNSASAEHVLVSNPRTEYGVLRWRRLVEQKGAGGGNYLKMILETEPGRYRGSPALAMHFFSTHGTRFLFHDMEQDALDNISAYAKKLGIPDRVETRLGDSIEALLNPELQLGTNDFVFIDPYTPFDGKGRHTFFDVFDKVSASGACAVLWHGYDSLNGHRKIWDALREIAKHNDLQGKVLALDAWQESMDLEDCSLNPGVPGCGIALTNYPVAARDLLVQRLALLEDLYRTSMYLEQPASLRTAVNEF